MTLLRTLSVIAVGLLPSACCNVSIDKVTTRSLPGRHRLSAITFAHAGTVKPQVECLIDGKSMGTVGDDILSAPVAPGSHTVAIASSGGCLAVEPSKEAVRLSRGKEATVYISARRFPW